MHAPPLSWKHFPARILARSAALAASRAGASTSPTPPARVYLQPQRALWLTPAHAAGAKLKQAIAGRSIPATNNGSERALRPCVVFRKVTSRFRSECHLYPDTRSVLETTRRNAVGAFQAIRMALYPMPLPDTR